MTIHCFQIFKASCEPVSRLHKKEGPGVFIISLNAIFWKQATLLDHQLIAHLSDIYSPYLR